MLATKALSVYAWGISRFAPVSAKRAEEHSYWLSRKREEGELENWWYERAFTDTFGMPLSFYEGKRILDIGCGPRGSLEWADMAAERVGLDPLTPLYERLGAYRQKMRYVKAPSEKIPYPDGYFDVVSSFNSLDHVDDLDGTITEVRRVAANGATFLLMTDVNHEPTRAEPHEFSWDIIDRFLGFEPLDVRHLERGEPGLYSSAEANVPYDHSDQADRYGLLVARLIRRR